MKDQICALQNAFGSAVTVTVTITTSHTDLGLSVVLHCEKLEGNCWGVKTASVMEKTAGSNEVVCLGGRGLEWGVRWGGEGSKGWMSTLEEWDRDMKRWKLLKTNFSGSSHSQALQFHGYILYIISGAKFVFVYIADVILRSLERWLEWWWCGLHVLECRVDILGTNCKWLGRLLFLSLYSVSVCLSLSLPFQCNNQEMFVMQSVLSMQNYMSLFTGWSIVSGADIGV